MMHTPARLPLLALLLGATVLQGVDTENPTLIFEGTEKADSRADGGLRPVIGVHNIQVIRANKTVSPHADGLLHSYLHAPMLAWWKGRFYLEYLSGPRDEHEPPCVTSFTTSADGLNWTTPRTAFPAITFPNGSLSVSHQRMGFYVSPQGRLLMLSFYGCPPSPNEGSGMGRAVREVHEDGSLGPVHFIRLNTHAGWTPERVPFPMYHKAEDKGFVEACEALLADKLATAQWWEEDRASDGFYTATGKALSYATRPDGSVLGIWKNAVTTTTVDKGKTWSRQVFAAKLPVNASKYWIQRTTDKAYALVYNPTNRLRHPLVVSTSEDSSLFRGMLTVHGELPDQRYGGIFKNMGPQYVRGISEGNGSGPDSALWLTYSVNKEDIWISRVPVPIQGRAQGPVNENFEAQPVGSLPEGWNVYSPLWAPVRVVNADATAGRALQLSDEDPYDYARAVKVFEPTHGLKLSFRVKAEQADGRLEVDVLTASGARPVRIAFEEDGRLRVSHEGQWQDAGAYRPGEWHRIELSIGKDAKSDRFDFTLDGQAPFRRAVVFHDPIETVERLSFRTGPHRERGEGGRDLPKADLKVSKASFLIDEISIHPVK